VADAVDYSEIPVMMSKGYAKETVTRFGVSVDTFEAALNSKNRMDADERVLTVAVLGLAGEVTTLVEISAGSPGIVDAVSSDIKKLKKILEDAGLAGRNKVLVKVSGEGSGRYLTDREVRAIGLVSCISEILSMLEFIEREVSRN
jgi:DNA-binding Lrp family transcriptional regulator